MSGLAGLCHLEAIPGSGYRRRCLPLNYHVGLEGVCLQACSHAAFAGRLKVPGLRSMCGGLWQGAKDLTTPTHFLYRSNLSDTSIPFYLVFVDTALFTAGLR